MEITKTSTRFVATVAGVAVALSLMVGAYAASSTAQAASLTSSQVSAIISLLQSFGADAATIANVQASLTGGTPSGSTGGSTSVGCTFTRALTMGSSGADVTCLQQGLIAMGYSIPAGATGYFGAQTQTAVAAWQAAKGVSPAAGYFGPVSQAAWGTSGPSTPTNPTNPAASGNEGELTSIDNTSTDVESEVDENQEENVFGVEMDAEDSEMTIERVDVDFTLSDASTGVSKHLDDYITEVSVVLDGKTLATKDVDEADENDNGTGDFDNTGDTGDNDVYSFRFTGLKGMIEEGETGTLYVVVKGVNNIDSTDTSANWYVLIPNDGIRAIDGAGISDTYVDSNDLTEEQFSVVEPNSGDLDLAAPAGDNLDRVITVSADSDTNNEDIMVFTLKSQSSDNNVSEIRVDLATTTSTSTTFATVIKQLKLYKGSTLLATSNVKGTLATTEYALFDDLDIDIDEDEKAEFTVKADFNDEADEREGFAFEASIVGANVDAEDAEGDAVTVSQTVTGGEIELRTTGIAAEFKSATANRTNGSQAGDADAVDFTIKFSVSAVGDDDIYLDGDTVQSVGTDGLVWATTTDSTTGTSTSITGILTADDGYQSDDVTTAGAKSFFIESGDTRDFTFTVNIPAGSDNTAAGVRITALKWDLDSDDSHANTYDFDMSSWTTNTVTGLYIR